MMRRWQLSHELTDEQRVVVAHYLRRERLLPLLRAIWRCRRMRRDAFAVGMYLTDPLGPADPFARGGRKRVPR